MDITDEAKADRKLLQELKAALGSADIVTHFNCLIAQLFIGKEVGLEHVLERGKGSFERGAGHGFLRQGWSDK